MMGLKKNNNTVTIQVAALYFWLFHMTEVVLLIWTLTKLMYAVLTQYFSMAGNIKTTGYRLNLDTWNTEILYM